eukprot:753779-Hanusia_phi.AAC.9
MVFELITGEYLFDPKVSSSSSSSSLSSSSSPPPPPPPLTSNPSPPPSHFVFFLLLSLFLSIRFLASPPPHARPLLVSPCSSLDLSLHFLSFPPAIPHPLILQECSAKGKLLYSREEDLLAHHQELLGVMPLTLTRGGRRFKDFFKPTLLLHFPLPLHLLPVLQISCSWTLQQRRASKHLCAKVLGSSSSAAAEVQDEGRTGPAGEGRGGFFWRGRGGGETRELRGREWRVREWRGREWRVREGWRERRRVERNEEKRGGDLCEAG